MNKNYNYFVNYLNQNQHKKNIKVLDFGAGVGKLLNILIENGIDAYGVDINHTNNKIKYLNNELIKNDRLSIIPENNKLPYDDEEFDVVISNMVFEHVFNIEFVLNEISRVLKKNGLIYLRFPSYEILREGHTGIPLTHRFKSKKILKAYMQLAYSIGFGINRNLHGDKDEWVDHMMDYLEYKTIYRKYKDLRKIFSKFEITHKEIDFLKFYFIDNKFIRYILNTPFKKILIYTYKKYVTMDFELKKLI